MGNNYWIPIIVIDLLAPMLISFGIYKAFRKLNYIKAGYLKLDRF